MLDKTTDLEAVRKDRYRFTWGYASEIYDVGPYTIVEAKEHFHVYVDGKNTGVSALTLDGALILAIAHKHLEKNEARYMAMAAAKVLGVKE